MAVRDRAVVWREGLVSRLYRVLLRVLAVAVPDPLEVERMVSVLDGKEEEQGEG